MEEDILLMNENTNSKLKVGHIAITHMMNGSSRSFCSRRYTRKNQPLELSLLQQVNTKVRAVLMSPERIEKGETVGDISTAD
jgi:hypothetical protein